MLPHLEHYFALRPALLEVLVCSPAQGTVFEVVSLAGLVPCCLMSLVFWTAAASSTMLAMSGLCANMRIRAGNIKSLQQLHGISVHDQCMQWCLYTSPAVHSATPPRYLSLSALQVSGLFAHAVLMASEKPFQILGLSEQAYISSTPSSAATQTDLASVRGNALSILTFNRPSAMSSTILAMRWPLGSAMIVV